MLGTLSVLGVAAWLVPDPAGLGTHRQLHLPPCGFYLYTGIPCPTCGCTTAFALAAHGRLLAAFQAQPAGAAFALLCAATTLVSAQALLLGASLAPLKRVVCPATLWVLGAGVLLAWVYKILLVTKVF
jgi:hypothetical protein